MKSKYSKSLFVVAIALCGPAFATGHKPPPPKHDPAPTATAVAGAAASAESRSAASSSSRATGGNARASGGNATATGLGGQGGQGGAGGLGGAGGNASQSQTAQGGAGGSANNAGNAQSVSFSNPRQLAAAPDAIAPNVYPSASCYHGKSGGVSFGNSAFGAGVSGGKDSLDEACDIRETARSFAAIGNLTAANTLLCSTPAALKYLSGACGTAKAPADPAPTVLVVPTGMSQAELNERDRKIIEAISSK